MKQTAKYGLGFVLGTTVTALLSMVLIVGTSSPVQPTRVLNQGSVRLSPLPSKTVAESEMYTTQNTPSMQPMEKINLADMAVEMPQFESSLSPMEMDFAPQIAGTAAVGGLPSLAAATAPAGGIAAPGGGALTLGEVDELPYPLYAPSPLYPADQKRLGNEQKVYVRIVLREDGTVKSARPLRRTARTAAFHDAAVEAVRQWRFFPCKKGGKAVQCVADQPFSFSIDN